MGIQMFPREISPSKTFLLCDNFPHQTVHLGHANPRQFLLDISPQDRFTQNISLSQFASQPAQHYSQWVAC